MIPEEKALIRRYLVWCYKTTKEELDRVDRKFTQLLVDYRIQNKLKTKKVQLSGHLRTQYEKSMTDFKDYIRNKEKDAHQLKFSDSTGKTPQPNYLYLH